jgi:hypothetical protein
MKKMGCSLGQGRGNKQRDQPGIRPIPETPNPTLQTKNTPPRDLRQGLAYNSQAWLGQVPSSREENYRDPEMLRGGEQGPTNTKEKTHQ